MAVNMSVIEEYLDYFVDLDLSNDFVKELRKYFKNNYESILNDLILFYLEFEDEELTAESKRSKLPFLIATINFKIDDNYKTIQSASSLMLDKIYTNSIKLFNENIKGEGTAQVLNILTNMVVNQHWHNDNLNVVERLNNHKAKLKSEIYTLLDTNINKGTTAKKTINELRDRVNVAVTNSQRLVRTEATRLINQAIKEVALAKGYTHYEYSAILDSRTSEICRSLDGLVFSFAESNVGENLPPMHVNCRSFIIPIETPPTESTL